MFGRVYRVFLRFAARHVVLERSGFQADSTTQVDRIALIDNRLLVQGWSDASRVGLSLQRGLARAVPSLSEMGSRRKGFELKLPYQPGPAELLLEHEHGENSYVFQTFSKARIRLAYCGQAFRFLAVLGSHLPTIWRWKVSGDLGAREDMKHALGLVVTSDAAELDASIFQPNDWTPPPSGVTIVLPVYNAFDLLQDALTRVERHTDLSWRLILIEDCSSDDRVCPFLRDWVAARSPVKIHLIENEQNLGFIGAVNRGLGVATTFRDPVVLLNSDALVPMGWASRLIAPILRDETVASVTPFSNDAEIFTVPSICRINDPPGGELDSLDKTAQGLNPWGVDVDAPTGVGFCMALNIEFLRQIPLLDPIFGRGYGEETDWCQKARALGGRHVCAINLVVEHRGGASFGSADKQALLEKNGQIIAQRYPMYPAEVQSFIREDLLASPRLALGLARAGLRGEVPIYLAHAMGGGAESYLKSRIAHHTAGGEDCVVLRVGQGHRWRLELHSVDGPCEGLTNDIGLVTRLLEPIPRRHVIYSCGVGDRDPCELPQVLLDLASNQSERRARLTVLFHDFFPLSPSYTLLNKQGQYLGVPRADNSDPAHTSERPGGRFVSLAQWRDHWRPLLERAEDLMVFSENSADLVAQAYPDSAPKIRVVPHVMAGLPSPISRATQSAPVIGILGNIGVHKGAEVVSALSYRLARTKASKLVVIGNVDPAFRIKPPSVVHGDYLLEELPQLVRQYGIDRWLVPSIWPETFSFTTREALATQLPVWVFDLGAQADAVKAAGGGDHILQLRPEGGVDIEDVLQRILGATVATENKIAEQDA